MTYFKTNGITIFMTTDDIFLNKWYHYFYDKHFLPAIVGNWTRVLISFKFYPPFLDIYESKYKWRYNYLFKVHFSNIKTAEAVYSPVFSPLQNLNTQKIININVISEVVFVRNAKISVEHSRLILNLHKFTQWAYLFACKQMYIETRLKNHTEGIVFKIRGVVLKLYILWQIRVFLQLLNAIFSWQQSLLLPF